ncbi:MAG: hypothetical protein J6Y43_08610 [Clostridia bacterium]|nr:hypothetical protein [Clostridia bacterium]
MLFDSLYKLKRNSILTAILLIALGTVILVCSERCVGLMIQKLGYTLVVRAIVMVAIFF